MDRQQKKRHPSTELSHERLSFVERHVWYMRWFILVTFTILLFCSLVIIPITGNDLFVPISGALFVAMRPIVRFTFPDKKENFSPQKQSDIEACKED